jgi:hypothetical protein
VPVTLALAAGAGVLALAGCNGSPAHPGAAGAPSTAGVADSSHRSTPTVCPLTGKPAPAYDVKRPALAVKIDNIPEALPQAGLDTADLVFQEQVEGGLTRLFGVWQCSPAPAIGPIRSARTTDADLLSLFHGSVFAYSGDNPAVMPPIEKVGDTTLVDWAAHPTVFHVDTSRVAPHDVFASSGNLLREGKTLHHTTIAAPPRLFSFGAPDPGATKAHTASMHWPGASAEWTWDGHAWLRTQDGSVDNTITGDRVTATNVLVLAVTLTSTGLRDVAGNPSPDDVTTGSGAAWLLRNGSVVKGTWSRPSPTATFTLKDSSGHVLNLSPGRTWVELLPDASTFTTTKH